MDLWNVYSRKGGKFLLGQENLVWISLDVTSDQSISNAFDVISTHTKNLDVLINNAGVNKDTATHHKPEQVGVLGSLTRAPLQIMFNINTIAPFIILKTFLPLLMQDPSFVINISSRRASFQENGESAMANYGYRASKVALNMMTLASVVDLPQNIKPARFSLLWITGMIRFRVNFYRLMANFTCYNQL
jgi:NAD(P)-dependent dehydrogenase (short-subunit alcohol dehydrogenase family)